MHKRRPLIFVLVFIVAVLAIIGGFFVAQYLSNLTHTAHQTTVTDSPHPQKTALSCVEALPESVQIGQKIMAATYSDQLFSSQAVFIQYGIGGIIVMDAIPAESITGFQKGFAIPLTVAVDQEGGTVQRYKAEGIVPGATAMSSDHTAAQAYDTYYADAQYLKSIGITVNFGPVLDVMSATPNPLPGRMYSSDPSVVAQYASQFIKASEKAGVTPVVKHFPGLGSTTTNTDDGSATTDPLATLQTRDIVPYKTVAQYRSDAMVSNAIVPGLTDGEPAIWSTAAVDLLRNEGYQSAVIYSDSLTANAVPGTIQDATIKAWQAGIDVALIVQKPDNTVGLPSTFEAIVAQATSALNNGKLDKTKFAESVVRILQRKGVNPCS